NNITSESEASVVSSMQVNCATGVVERIEKKTYSKGVNIELTDRGILIDLYVVLNFGQSIPQVAQDIQTNIRETLKNMTALDVEEINVHVVGIEMEKKTKMDDESYS